MVKIAEGAEPFGVEHMGQTRDGHGGHRHCERIDHAHDVMGDLIDAYLHIVYESAKHDFVGLRVQHIDIHDNENHDQRLNMLQEMQSPEGDADAADTYRKLARQFSVYVRDMIRV